jgi:hypothetical protein
MLQDTMHDEVYYLNLENYILDRFWNHRLYPVHQYLTGVKRLYFRPWIYLILKHLDGSLIHYTQWIKQGGGDVWFESLI